MLDTILEMLSSREEGRNRRSIREEDVGIDPYVRMSRTRANPVFFSQVEVEMYHLQVLFVGVFVLLFLFFFFFEGVGKI
jgi:hypothetical protein